MILVLFLFSSDTISFCFSFNYKFCYFCMCSSNVIAHNLQTTAQPNKLKIFTLQSLLTTLGTKITESQFSRSTWSGIHFHPCARLKRLVHTIHVATWFFFGHYFCGRSEHISDDQRLGSSDDSPSFVKSPPYILRSQPGWGSDYSVDSFPDRQTPIAYVSDVNGVLSAITSIWHRYCNLINEPQVNANYLVICIRFA